jgi:3'-phosphoadenosine 5'-phosphosulfate sulfotransferase (PAPS reductase)/FAD synthetase
LKNSDARLVTYPTNNVEAYLAQLLARHRRVHVAFSGGRDSVVLVDLCRSWRERVTLIWANTGLMWPHMADFVRGYGDEFRLIEAKPGRHFADVWRNDGLPADVVPVENMLGRRWPRIQPWTSCCAALRTRPVFDAAVKDGATLLLHGQRASDAHMFRAHDNIAGMPDGLEIAGPIWDWTDIDVAAYVERRELALPGHYRGLASSLECTICPANNSKGENELRMDLSPPLAAVAQSLGRTVRKAAVGVLAGIERDGAWEDRPARWDAAESLIFSALAYDTGQKSLAQIRGDYLEQRSELFGDGHAVLLTEFRDMEGGKTLYGYLGAGEMRVLTEILRPQAELFAIAHGCVAAFISGRRGWMRVLRRHGYVFEGHSDKPYSWTMAKSLSAA